MMIWFRMGKLEVELLKWQKWLVRNDSQGVTVAVNINRGRVKCGAYKSLLLEAFDHATTMWRCASIDIRKTLVTSQIL